MLRPPRMWEGLVAAALAPGGSAPGVDGEPYEVHHIRVQFVSRLLGQAAHADGSERPLAAVARGFTAAVHVLCLLMDSLPGQVAEVIVWDFQAREVRHRFRLHKQAVSSLAFSADSKLLASQGCLEDK